MGYIAQDQVTLADFLLARIGEDESTARDAEVMPGMDANGFSAVFVKDRKIGVHVGPARVLADIEAKRRIVDLHSPHPQPQRMVYGTITACSTCGSIDDSPEEWPCDTLRLLALPYADHPGYQREWKP